ncbi:MAG: GDP-mannose 4,6-dehydratase [Candidatus Hodarchaeales archaeon]|jgi:UDP-glucose 4-epimerase
MTNTPSSLKWLITGGCGFIGTSLINYLLRENPEMNIRILDNLSTGSKENLFEITSSIKRELKIASKNIELIEGDIRDFDTCNKCCEGIDIIVHLAANTGVAPSVQNPRADMESNVIGIFNMLEAARINNIIKFIFASSGAPIGEVEPPIHEEKAPKPVSPYGASKLAGEAYCSAYFRTFGIKTIALRFGNVYGPLSKHKNSVVASFLKQAFAKAPLVIFGDGYQTRDFLYIDDLIQAIMLSVKSDVGGEVFQIATHRETTINEITEEIKSLLENEVGINITVHYAEPRPGDVKRNFSDISKAKQILGFEPRYDLEKGLKETFEYFRSKTTF